MPASQARIRANRLNAKKSTGPRTAAGRARVAQNALVHGLDAVAMPDKRLRAEIDRLTHLIAGQGADEDVVAAARNIARAQVELGQIRQVRFYFWKCVLEAEKTGGNKRAKLPRLRKRDSIGRLLRMIDKQTDVYPTPLERLARLDRNERRALSRRKSAIRILDHLLAQRRLSPAQPCT